MDRITRSYLKDFITSHGFENEQDECKLFEYFVNYSIIEHKVEERFELEEISIGKDSTFGIDGFAIILNKRIVHNEDELNEILKTHNDISAEIVFIQSKTSRNFEIKEIGNFQWAITDFISEEHKIKWSKVAQDKISLLEILFKSASKLRDKPICLLYYVTLGTLIEDQNISAKINDTIKDIQSENIFSKILFERLGANEIQGLYKKIGQALTKSFEFQNKVMLPVIDNVKEAYLGIIKASTIIELMTGDDGGLLPNVFYDNVRDFQGDINVNKEIANTLKSNYKDAFSILNNGITIVAEELITSRNTFTISNYQIINGCQTSNVLYVNQGDIDDSVLVPIKLISSTNSDLTARLIRSTNRQTEVKEQDLLAFSNFQKNLEVYYKTYTGDSQLYYERRSKQYSKTIREKKRIIDKTTQIKAVASFYFNRPDMATRYFGTLFNDFSDKLFNDNHHLILYYTASYALYMIEDAFRRGFIDKRFKKIKYFILMMLRYEIDPSPHPPFSNLKIVNYCESLLNKLNSDKELKYLIDRIIKKITSLKIDLDDREISKSKTLVDKCLKKYNK